MYHLLLFFVSAFALLIPGRLDGAECDYAEILRENGDYLLMRTMDSTELVGLVQQVAAGEVPRIRATGTINERRGKRKFQDRLSILGQAQSNRWAYPLVTRTRTMSQGEVQVRPDNWRAGLLFSPEVINKSTFLLESSLSDKDKKLSVVAGKGEVLVNSYLNPEAFQVYGTFRERERILFEENARYRHLNADESIGDIEMAKAGEKVEVFGDLRSEARNSLYVHLRDGLDLADLKGIWFPSPMLRDMVLPGIHEYLKRPYRNEPEYFKVIEMDEKPTYTVVGARKDEGFDESSSQGNWYAATPNWKEIAGRLDQLEGGVRLLDPEVLFDSMFSKP